MPSEQTSLFEEFTSISTSPVGSATDVTLATPSSLASRGRQRATSKSAAPKKGRQPKSAATKMKWSHSAHKTFRRCQTQYLLGNLLAHHSARDEVRHLAFVLKQIKNIALWRGNLVDDAIELWVAPYLELGRLMPLDELLERTFSMMEEQLAFSKARRHLEGVSKTEAQKSYLVLDVHERGEEAASEQLDWVRAEVTEALTNLYSLEEFLAGLRGHSLYQPRHRFTFPLDAFNVSGEFDLLISKRDGGLLIIDWKVVESPTSDHTDQMLLYALAASRLSRGLSPEQIEVQEVRLRESEIRNYPLTREKLADGENFVWHSAHQMKALTQGLSATEQHIEDFEVADKPGTCALCSLRPLCQQLRSAAANQQKAAVLC